MVCIVIWFYILLIYVFLVLSYNFTDAAKILLFLYLCKPNLRFLHNLTLPLNATTIDCPSAPPTHQVVIRLLSARYPL